ncbi:hypothetical protein SAMN05216464_110211 [Mucilaginibacter pineti]|uniref:Uncharacterized protein n=1 Tax=Mucilaginibacter pineti TaxID=1391627 RepID=A0A1G7GM42_9SPHI|nr:hypothetical protein [Mucilaginibacter pineti]SDE89258.1 hypothetical protein SAMN05216464_110211 [Mucilaginibacter pineti]
MPNEINKQILSDVNTGTDQLKNQAIEMSKSLDIPLVYSCRV